MSKEINLSAFNLDYCSKFSEAKLREIFSYEPKEVLDALIAKVKGNKKTETT